MNEVVAVAVGGMVERVPIDYLPYILIFLGVLVFFWAVAHILCKQIEKANDKAVMRVDLAHKETISSQQKTISSQQKIINDFIKKGSGK